MDLVLEAFDTLCLDRLFAAAFPRNANYNPTVAKLLSLKPPSDNILNFSSGAVADSVNATEAAASLPVGVLASVNSLADLFGAATQHSYSEDGFLFSPTVYSTASAFARTNWLRQLVSLTVIVTVFGAILYLGTAALSYYLVYDKENMKHPKFLKNQMSMEIKQALSAIPGMSFLTAACFVAELLGYSKLYWRLEDYPSWYLWAQVPLFIMFTDFGIYLIHRGLHHKLIYKHLHKPHHKWIVSTPFASHAFHPLDGFLQSVPYHLFPFVFPLQKGMYMCLFVFINIWTVMIHDGDYLARDPVINGAACHTIHHLYFNYNYGQYTTLWDRIGGSYRVPDDELFEKDKKNDRSVWKAQSNKMEAIQKTVENVDDRVYVEEEGKKDK